MDSLFGYLWLASSAIAGALHFWFKRKPLTALFAAFCALAAQLGIGLVVALSVYWVSNRVLWVDYPRREAVTEWLGVGLFIGVLALWGWIFSKANTKT